MKTMTKFLASVAVTAAFALPAQAQDAETVLATVNGVDITLGHMVALYESLPAEYKAVPVSQIYAPLLDQLVTQELLAASVRGNLTKSQQLTLQNHTRSVLANEVLETTVAGVTDAELQAAYDERFATPEPEFNASHILVGTQEEAASLVSQLADGADFAELARTFSTGPSGPNGGELGWFGLGQMVPQFEQAVVALEVGEVSEPVETQFGWHVVLLNDKRTAGAPPLEQVRDELVDVVRESRVQARIEALREEGAVMLNDDLEIDPELLRNADLIAD